MRLHFVAGTHQGSMASTKVVAKPKDKQTRQKATATPTTMKAAPPKDTVLLPARLQGDGAELAQSVPSLRAELTEVFRQALESAYPSANIEPVVAQTNEPKFGDYQCNNAMALFGQLRGKVRCLIPMSSSHGLFYRIVLNIVLHAACVVLYT